MDNLYWDVYDALVTFWIDLSSTLLNIAILCRIRSNLPCNNRLIKNIQIKAKICLWHGLHSYTLAVCWITFFFQSLLYQYFNNRDALMHNKQIPSNVFRSILMGLSGCLLNKMNEQLAIFFNPFVYENKKYYTTNHIVIFKYNVQCVLY